MPASESGRNRLPEEPILEGEEESCKATGNLYGSQVGPIVDHRRNGQSHPQAGVRGELVLDLFPSKPTTASNSRRGFLMNDVEDHPEKHHDVQNQGTKAGDYKGGWIDDVQKNSVRRVAENDSRNQEC